MRLQSWVTIAGKIQPSSQRSCQFFGAAEARRVTAAYLRRLKKEGKRHHIIIRGHAWTDGTNHLRLY